MKKLIAYPLTHTLFQLGHWVSIPMNYYDWFWLYPLYNKLMVSSLIIQRWANLKGPWKK